MQRSFDKYDQKDLIVEDYENCVKTQEINGTPYSEQTIGSRKKLFVYSSMVATTAYSLSLPLSDLSERQFNSFLGMFNKTLYKQFLAHPELYDLNVKFEGDARWRNVEFWNSLPKNTYFYNIDLNSAYWQIARKLGYITETVFDKYFEIDSYKEAKRYCISFLARPNKMKYNTPQGSYEIICDSSVLKRIYDNIRNCLYDCISKSIEGIQDCLEYNIDGVSVMASELDKVRSNFKDMGLKYKVIECRKISDTEYQHKGMIRKFKNK